MFENNVCQMSIFFEIVFYKKLSLYFDFDHKIWILLLLIN